VFVSVCACAFHAGSLSGGCGGVVGGAGVAGESAANEVSGVSGGGKVKEGEGGGR
jgi:hypothetical protein